MINNFHKTVITYGTFDMFNYGHLRLLQRAKKVGQFLIVGVTSDDFNVQQNKHTLCCFEHRISIIKELKCVNKIIIQNSLKQIESDIVNYKVDILVTGDSNFKYDNLPCEILYLSKTPLITYSSIHNQV